MEEKTEFKNKVLKVFNDKVAMTISVVENRNAYGYLLLVEAALLNAELTKASGANRFDWDNKVTSPVDLDGMLGFLMVGLRYRSHYKCHSGAAVVQLKRQTNEYEDKYPCVLTVVANKDMHEVKLTPGKTAALLTMLTKASADSNEISVIEQVRLLEAFK